MISIVVPAYNEEEVIEKSISELFSKVKIKEGIEIVVVNDGSKDNTLKILEKLKIKFPLLKIANHPKNKGFGEALKTGIKKAEGRIIVTMDSDLTHPAELVVKMVEKIDSGYDVCIASRYVRNGGMENVPLWRVLLSYFTNLTFSAIFFTRTRDLTGGFKAYKTEMLKKVNITRSDFSVQMEIIVALLKYHAKISEIPLMLSNRTIGVSKFDFSKNAPKYINAVFSLFIYRWFSRR